jgi:catechol 2,3-dioxygenase-like lactoylglutathione lyase family enzyme
MSETAVAATPIKIKKLGHFVYEVSDIDRSTRFWTELLGFHVTDRNEQGFVFLRNATDHHTIALVPGKHDRRATDGNAVHHLAMEVDDVEDLFRARDFLKARGIELLYEGRRGPGGNPGIEFRDPDGYMFELYTKMDQIGSDGKSRPPEQWSRVATLEDVVAKPLPSRW